MVVKPLASLLPLRRALAGINGELPVENTGSVSICPHTSAVLPFPLIPLLSDIRKSLLWGYVLFGLCFLSLFPKQVAEVISGML